MSVSRPGPRHWLTHSRRPADRRLTTRWPAARRMAETGLNRKLRQQALAGLSPTQASNLDRRVVRVNITAEGRGHLERIRPLENAFLIRRVAALGPAEKPRADALTGFLEHLVSHG
jgi:hypothetical protein